MPIINSASIGNISAGIGDLYAAKADKAKAAYDITEGKEYDLASQLALQNEQFTQMSTAIKDAQTSREIAKSEGATSAAVAGGGFAESGSALDILRDSAKQGAITRAVGQEQGLVTEAGYQEQADSYKLMAGAANQAAAAEMEAAKGAKIGAGLQLAAAVVNMIPGQSGGGGGGSDPSASTSSSGGGGE